MRGILAHFFGAEGTLKRETIVICWLWISFMIVRVFAFVPPEHVRNYEALLSSVLWPTMLLMAAIFGIQLGGGILGRGSQETTTVSTPSQTIKTEVVTEPRADVRVG